MPDTNFRVPTTQRAYTMRLQRTPGACQVCGQENCDCLERALWETHLLVNRGALVFGDRLLTLRGGLDHALAQQGAPSHVPNRRRLLALGWLSVEDEAGARRLHPEWIVTTGKETESERRRKVERAFREILRHRGLSDAEIEDWWNDCRSSLTAAIRDDAAVVNRDAAFTAAMSLLPGLTRNTFWEDFGDFFGQPNLYFGESRSTEGVLDATNETVTEDRAEPKDLVQQASKWLSRRFGKREGANFAALADIYEIIAQWCDEMLASDRTPASLDDLARHLDGDQEHRNVLQTILGRLSGPGYKSATRNWLKTISEKHRSLLDRVVLDRLATLCRKDSDNCRAKIGKKGRRPWSDKMLQQVESDCGGFTYHAEGSASRHKQFSVMLDHAARRVSGAISWIRNAEQRRQRSEEDARKRESLQAEAPEAVTWLDEYVARRSKDVGADGPEGYRIRKRALEGWKDLVQRWATLPRDDIEGRIRCVREMQQEQEEGKVGDKILFETLAQSDALVVWKRPDGVADWEILKRYVDATEAEWNQRRFKVPMYRHPDPLRHPVFVDYGESRWTIAFTCHTKKNDSRDLELELWDGRHLRKFRLRWASTRLARDLLSVADQEWSPDGEVPRTNRLGRATAEDSAPIHMSSLFEKKEWNGRLQAPRRLLLKAATESSSPSGGSAPPRNLHWSLTFSAPLQPAGPWIRYALASGLRWDKRGLNVHSLENKHRKGMARLSLCRLPGLRVLSVDLGHRFAAACAVWQTLSLEDFRKETDGREILAGGRGPENLFLHAREVGPDGRPRTRIYRRIAADQLGDSPHPAPWARLDRQFLIRLPGEDAESRKASPAETEQVRQWEDRLGRVRGPWDPLPTAVDALMREALDTARLGLRRHGLRARIAWAWTADVRLLPGGRQEALNEATRENLILEALVNWSHLVRERRWSDPWARDLWRREGLPSLDESAEGIDDAPSHRRRQEAELEDRLRPFAKRLAGFEADRLRLAKHWKDRWVEEDCSIWAGPSGVLRGLKDWIAPRGLRIRPEDDEETRVRKRQAQAACRRVGGLSLTRIGNVTDLYRLQKAFRTRPHPEDPRRNIPQRGEEELADFERRLLEMRDRLREQRVRQLCSRIIEAALGLGRHPKERPGQQTRRPTKRLDEPCHAIVIESLEHYRPEQTRTRRENRMLMQWSSAQAKKFLSEGAALHGLHLWEVQAAYTSRQDSRTGRPGLRCNLVTLRKFIESPWWRGRVHQAQRRLEQGNQGALDALMLTAEQACQEGRMDPETQMLLPAPGGEWFLAAPVPGDAASDRRGRPGVLQADLNAAANIGLRALTDPDWPGSWWYVPCTLDGTPAPERVKGSAAIPDGPLHACTETPGQQTGRKSSGPKKSKTSGDGEIRNLWRDPDPRPLNQTLWKTYQDYLQDVEARVARVLRAQFPMRDPPSSLD